MSTQRVLVSIELTKTAEEGKPDRVYTLLLPYLAPVGEAFDITVEFGKEIMEMAKRQAEAAKAAAKPAEEVQAELVEKSDGDKK